MLTVDGYSDLDRIGHGGLGDVYRATRDSTGDTVAIKVLRDVSDESVAWHRTRRELTALVSLSGHAHVIRLLELLDIPEGPALVMEYAPGGSVADLVMRRGGTLDVAEAVLVGRHTADALVAAHEQDIVHRDLKPQNLLIDAYGRIKLCDFGIASLARSEDFRTRTSALSLRYASPEDLDEDAEVGPPSDVYSLGATLLHLVHGIQLTVKDRLQPWIAPPTADADLAALDRVVEQCLRPEPDDRPSSPVVLDRLEAIDWTLAERCRGLPVASTAPDRRHDTGGSNEADDTGGRGRRGAMTPTSSDGGDPAVPAAPGTQGPDAAAEGTVDDLGRREAFAATPRGWESPFGDTSSPTAQRSDAALPARPRPDSVESDRRRWPWVGAAIAAAAVIGVVGALAWPSSDEVSAPADEQVVDTVATTATAAVVPSQGQPDAFDVVDRTPGLPPLDDETVTWPFGPAGECLVQVNGLDELRPVDCAEPHDLQRYAVGDVDALGVPDESTIDEIRTATDDACRVAFVELVGTEESESVLRIAVTRPSPESWAAGDRRYQCLLGVPGRHVVGDAASSGT